MYFYSMNILLVDNNTLFIQALALLLSSEPDMNVTGKAATIHEALSEIRKSEPDIMIVDPCRTRELNFEHCKKIKDEFPDIKCLTLTDSENEDDLYQAMKNGSHGYLLKKSTPDQLFSALRNIQNGDISISPYMAGRLIKDLLLSRENSDVEFTISLTPRQLEILELLSAGNTDIVIGEQLCISPSTVRHHVHSILQKLQLKNRMQLVMYFRNRKLPLY